MKKSLLLFIKVFFFIALATQVYAQSANLSIQGILKNSDGTAVDDGNYAMTFRLYESDAGGTPVWEEEQPSVEVKGGVYSALLGSTNALDAPFNVPYYLGVSIEGSTELVPRVALTFSPYALSLVGNSNVFASDGNVGVGTLAPEEKLHVIGSGKFSGDLDVGGAATIEGDMTINGSLNLSGGLADLTLSGNTTVTGLVNFTSTSEASTSAGDVVFGTTSGKNIVMDSDEIQARNNGSTSDLSLNPAGGNVVIGGNPLVTGAQGFKIVAGYVNHDGSVNSGTGFTVTYISSPTGSYRINFSSPFSQPPVVVANVHRTTSASQFFIVINSSTTSATIRVTPASGGGLCLLILLPLEYSKIIRPVQFNFFDAENADLTDSK